jgi:hypothetical protein
MTFDHYEPVPYGKVEEIVAARAKAAARAR